MVVKGASLLHYFKSSKQQMALNDAAELKIANILQNKFICVLQNCKFTLVRFKTCT